MHPSELLLETLRLGDSSPAEDLRAGWISADTRGLRDLVTFEGCALWLYRRLRQLEIGGRGTIDEPFFVWLGRLARRAAAQNEMVYQHAEVVARVLKQEGVTFVLLKGNALRFAAEGFPFATARATNDVDVLVRESDARRMEQRLLEIGYNYHAPPELTPVGHYHIRPLTNESGVPVELHFSTSAALTYDEAWNRLLAGAVRIEARDTEYLIPSATELFWHGTTHAVFHNAHAFRLRFFLDAASILATDTPLDWGIVEPRLDSAEVPGRERAVAWLGAAAWLAGTALPGEMSDGVPPFPLKRVLRWRLEVLKRLRLGGRMAEKLLDEGTRAEVGMPVTPAVRSRALPIRIRRRTAAFVARWSYYAWRALSRGEAPGS